ncbi:hypothetical protein CERZMDRAFT_102135 [Cercospora zeae-maydis SCOH1-5]|uniref:Uncharacterized protein n=1 Tax=Cercospora zeae-maydis SCOH1-5 TaxID=717836 RepID=A0A6A6F3B5_9PEZI|nr:hypothetical protein CERZMDRAFT_102135 [Cercospora zeae-maydis SCOH1-5]
MATNSSSKDWMDEDDHLAKAYLAQSPVDDMPRDSSASRTYEPCDCNDCARFKKAADQVDDVQCWTNRSVQESIFRAQKFIWRSRKLLHRFTQVAYAGVVSDGQAGHFIGAIRSWTIHDHAGMGRAGDLLLGQMRYTV